MAEPVDASLFVPWPLAPGAPASWRDGGRFCAWLMRDERLPEPFRSAFRSASSEAWHAFTLPATDGGTVSAGEVVARRRVGDVPDGGRLGFARVVRVDGGVMVAGVLAAGVSVLDVAAGVFGADWKQQDEGGHALTSVVVTTGGMVHPTGEGAVIQVNTGPVIGRNLRDVRRALEETGGATDG